MKYQMFMVNENEFRVFFSWFCLWSQGIHEEKVVVFITPQFFLPVVAVPLGLNQAGIQGVGTDMWPGLQGKPSLWQGRSRVGSSDREEGSRRAWHWTGGREMLKSGLPPSWPRRETWERLFYGDMHQLQFLASRESSVESVSPALLWCQSALCVGKVASGRVEIACGQTGAAWVWDGGSRPHQTHPVLLKRCISYLTPCTPIPPSPHFALPRFWVLGW